MRIKEYSSSNQVGPLTVEQKREVIDKVERAIDTGVMNYPKEFAIPMIVRSDKIYDVLADFLEESDVVYKIESDNVYIWEYRYKKYCRLVNYKYDPLGPWYTLYLIGC